MLLHAGPVQADYSDGNLRYIRIDNQEVVRMIYFAIRDRDWNTLSHEISGEEINSSANSFSVKFTSKVRENGFHFNWKVHITGAPDGSIQFNIQGQAANSFLTNRAGLCVLHATDQFAGTPCCIEHPDGYFSHKYFLEAISPHQPFLNIRAMEWPVGKTGRVRLDFEGDIFETEDQRNWSDASYKTYCTPLELPFPKLLEKGTVINQSVRLTVTDVITLQKPLTETISVYQNDAYSTFPKLGLQLASSCSAHELEFVKHLKINHLRKDILLSDDRWREQLMLALEKCRLCETSLELAVFCNVQDKNMPMFLNAMTEHASAVKSILFFDAISGLTNPDFIANVIPNIREQLPHVELGGGTDTHFAEFNRNRMDYGAFDFVSFSLTPLAHLKDDLTMIDNMQAQFDMINSARAIAPGKKVQVSPITLKPRSKAAAADNEAFKNNYDSSQTSQLAAGWTLGSIKYLAEAGADSITYFETSGPGGIMDEANIYPVGALLQFILNWKPAEIKATSSDFPLKITSLLMLRAERKESCLLIANHTAEKQTVDLDLHIDLKYTKITFTINEDAASELQDNVLTLAPWAVVAL